VSTDSDRAWQRWGETEPYYGVLTDARFRGDALAENRAAFFKLGHNHIAERLRTAEQHFGAFGRGRALDFGCGVGRLTLPLARQFGETLGLDVAPAMIEEARRNAAADQLGNVSFLLSDDALSAAQGRFDFVMSELVFQHIPIARGLMILQRLLDRVEVGGIAALQMCIDRQDDTRQRLHYWTQRRVPGGNGLLNLLRGRPFGEPLMQMNPYPPEKVFGFARDLGFGPAIVQVGDHGRFVGGQFLMRRYATSR
jgi:SAM-dependent methyltransferase